MNENNPNQHTLQLIIPNETTMVYPVQNAAKSYAELIGFEPNECYHIELFLEEVLSNIIKFDFMPGQKENIDISFNKTVLGLSITIHSNSIPLDIEKINSFSSVDREKILKYNASGLGSLLINKLADRVIYMNKGKEGQFIYIEKDIAGEPVSRNVLMDEPKTATTAKTDFNFYVRRLKSEEAYFISQLAYYAYHVSYIYDKIYYPEMVRRLNQEDELISVVAVNTENEDIIGHVAATMHEICHLPEMAVAFVNPSYRGGGCLVKSSEYLIDLLKTKKSEGVIVQAVTTHPYSQKSAYRLNLRETALYISRLTPLLMNEIKEDNQVRESLLLMYLPFQSNKKQIYVPTHHADMITAIFNNFGQAVEILTTDNETVFNTEEAKISVTTDAYKCGFIIVKQYGCNTTTLIQKTLKSLCINRIETVYVHLPLENPEISDCCQALEDVGFFFGGIMQTAEGSDYLMLQYLNNQIYNYDTLEVFSDFAKELAAYVRCHDPNRE